MDSGTPEASFTAATFRSWRGSQVRVALGLAQKDGGDERIRTADPLVANEVLSQLSYSPKNLLRSNKFLYFPHLKLLSKGEVRRTFRYRKIFI